MTKCNDCFDDAKVRLTWIGKRSLLEGSSKEWCYKHFFEYAKDYVRINSDFPDGYNLELELMKS